MSKLFERMKRNPAGDRTIKDIENICKQYGITCTPPRGGGSHYKISHIDRPEILTMPYRRRIKVIYIRKLVAYISALGAEHG